MNALATAQEHGWEEKRCRDFIIHMLESVPRNFNYQDGMRLIHRTLEIAFGDENGHLATGVLEELIEIEGFPPFPESIFQRWKYAYRNRNIFIESPYTPHTRTILLPTVATQRAIENRPTIVTSGGTRNASRSVSPYPLSIHETRSEASYPNAYILYGSKNGRKPRILSSPRREEVQQKLMDPNFGRGGTLQSIQHYEPPGNTASHRNQALAKLNQNETKTPSLQDPDTDKRPRIAWLCMSANELRQHLRNLARSNRPQDEQKEIQEEEQNSGQNFTQLFREMFRLENSGAFDFQKHLEEMNWPPGVAIPNGNFARKFGLVPVGEALPVEILYGMQSSIIQQDERACLNFWIEAQREIDNLGVEGESVDSGLLRQRFFELHTKNYDGPLPTSLFYDGSLDFKWGPMGDHKSERSTSPGSFISRATNFEDGSMERGDASHRNLGTSSLSVDLLTVQGNTGSCATSFHSALSQILLETSHNEVFEGQISANGVSNTSVQLGCISTEDTGQRDLDGIGEKPTDENSYLYILPKTTYAQPVNTGKSTKVLLKIKPSLSSGKLDVSLPYTPSKGIPSDKRPARYNSNVKWELGSSTTDKGSETDRGSTELRRTKRPRLENSLKDTLWPPTSSLRVSSDRSSTRSIGTESYKDLSYNSTGIPVRRTPLASLAELHKSRLSSSFAGPYNSRTTSSNDLTSPEGSQTIWVGFDTQRLTSSVQQASDPPSSHQSNTMAEPSKDFDGLYDKTPPIPPRNIARLMRSNVPNQRFSDPPTSHIQSNTLAASREGFEDIYNATPNNSSRQTSQGARRTAPITSFSNIPHPSSAMAAFDNDSDEFYGVKPPPIPYHTKPVLHRQRTGAAQLEEFNEDYGARLPRRPVIQRPSSIISPTKVKKHTGATALEEFNKRYEAKLPLRQAPQGPRRTSELQRSLHHTLPTQNRHKAGAVSLDEFNMLGDVTPPPRPVLLNSKHTPAVKRLPSYLKVPTRQGHRNASALSLDKVEEEAEEEAERFNKGDIKAPLASLRRFLRRGVRRKPADQRLSSSVATTSQAQPSTGAVYPQETDETRSPPRTPLKRMETSMRLEYKFQRVSDSSSLEDTLSIVSPTPKAQNLQRNISLGSFGFTTVFNPDNNTSFDVTRDANTGIVTATARVEIRGSGFSPTTPMTLRRPQGVANTTPTFCRMHTPTMMVQSANSRSSEGVQSSYAATPALPARFTRTDHNTGTGSTQRNFLSNERLRMWQNRRRENMGFDGTSDEFSERVPPLGNPDNTNSRNNTYLLDNGCEVTVCPDALLASLNMSTNQEVASPFKLANTEPLRIYKQPKQVRIAQGQQPQQLAGNSPPKENNTFPPRTSSMRNSNDLSAAESLNHRKVAHTRKQSDATSGIPSTLSSYRGHYLSDASGGLSSTADTARSTVSSYSSHYMSGSTDIIGNFMPIAAQSMAVSAPDAHGANSIRGNINALGKVKTAKNPYQFEPDTPIPARHYSHQTTFTDFITDPHESELAPSPQVFYLKKSPSMGNDVATRRKPTPMVPFASKPGVRGLQRCESSPNVSTPARFMVEFDRGYNPDLAAQYGDIIDPASPIQRGRSPPPQTRRGRSCEENSTPIVPFQAGESYFRDFRPESPLYAPTSNERMQNFTRELRPESPVRAPTSNQHKQSYVRDAGSESPVRAPSSNQHIPSHLRESRPESPLRGPSRDVGDQYHGSSTTSRHAPRSPTKTLRDVVERDENDDDESVEAPRSPKKRSRSPMKKMFGERGWLGRSPAEAADTIRQNQKIADRKDKMSVMGKLKTKLGEFAEKADLSPMGRSRHNNEKPAKISVLSVSLGPPEQARILMEVELMLVHTANSFLMNQFSQGRMAVDSIKKTVDAWKARGRPTVIEFMYDQATQRDLVAINQHNFRFYGDRAGDSVRINSMLYSWKLVASQMSLRTFCDADTVILKLLFDIEQILELLGGRDPLMLRLQQIRATANERMRLARQRKERDSAQDVPMGRERTWHSNSSESADGPSIRESMDDPYGGLKLVPDSYREYN